MTVEQINEKTELVEVEKRGRITFWLWDDYRKMNLAMNEPTAKAALIEALEYYQNRLIEVEAENQEYWRQIKQINEILNEEREDG